MDVRQFFLPYRNGIGLYFFCWGCYVCRNTQTGLWLAGFTNSFNKLVIAVRCFNKNLCAVFFTALLL